MKKLYVGAGVIAALIAVLLTALPTILHAAGLHPVYEGPTVALPGKRALIITTSHSVLAAPGETEGPETGVMASEFTHPYYTFLDNGMTVDMASIQGGLIPIDPQTLSYPVSTPEDERYLNDSVAQTKVQHSLPIADVDISQYDIVFISGGGGPPTISHNRRRWRGRSLRPTTENEKRSLAVSAMASWGLSTPRIKTAIH